MNWRDVLSVGIYTKQLTFFFALAAVTASSVLYLRTQISEASVRQLPPIPSTSIYSQQVALVDGGEVTINNKPVDDLIHFRNDSTAFNLQVFQADGSFVSQITTTVTLPRPINPSQVIARHFASFGVETPEPVVTGSQITYTAFNLTPTAEYRIELVLPKDAVKPSLWRSIVDGLANLPAPVWIAVAVALPMIAALILGILFWSAMRTWRGAKVIGERSTPPEAVAPAIAGVLIEGKVSPRSLAATLLDLAERKCLQVVHRADGFYFSRAKYIEASKTPIELNAYEQILLDKMFTTESTRSTLNDIQLRIGRHVFSRKIAQMYIEMYQAAVEKGWFVRDPQQLRKRFRFIAVVVSLIAVAGFVLSLLLGPTESRFYLLGWIGLFFVGIVMYEVTPFLPRRTAEGEKVYRQWQEFRNYLAHPLPLGNIAEAQGLYERYLPYAIVFGVEVEWTERFRDLAFVPPAWYTSAEDIHVIEDFANSLFPFIGTVAYDLAKAREPNAV